MKKQLLIVGLITNASLFGLSELAQDYVELARNALQKGNNEKAETYFLKAVDIDNREIEPHFLLGNHYAMQGTYAKALDQYRAVIAQRDNIPTILYNAAYCCKALGKIKEARGYYEKALKLNPDHGDAHQGLSHTLLALGEYEAAWPHFEYRWSIPRKDSKQFIEFMHANGDLNGKTVLLRGEYGLGDSFQFIRYAQLVKAQGARVIVEAQKPLVQLLSLCPYIDQVIPADSKLPAHDLACTLMSLPYAFRTTIKTIPTQFPYLHADKKLAQEWQFKLAHDIRFKIGICWNGNVYDTKILQDLVKEKSVPLSMLAELADIPGVSLYSIQKTSGTDQLKNLPRNFKITSFDTDFDESHGRFMDTAALMESLDLIITIDTSIAHLAGGLNKKTFLLLPYAADWRWMQERTDSPWYPNMSLFRQHEQGDWKVAIENVIKAVKNEITTKKNNKSIEQLPVKALEKQRFIPYNNQDIAQVDPNVLAQCAIECYKNRDLSQALEIFNTLALKIPNNPMIHFNLGKIFQDTQQYRQAIIAYKKTLELKPDVLQAYSGLGTCYLILSEMETAWHYWRAWFARRDTVAADAKPLWQGESLTGKRILIEDEGGFGDIFQWIRYADIFKANGAYVILETKESIIPLLSLCKSIDQFVVKGKPRPAHDVRVPFERIHCQANTTMENIPAKVPYLRAKQELVEYWREKLSSDKNFKIGICWSAQQFIDGQTGQPIPNHRSIPLNLLTLLSSVKNVSLYSLQQVTGLDQLNQGNHRTYIETFGDDFDKTHGKFMDTAAVMMSLDLIITVDTSIAHLAGALGCPTWVMLPQACDWRWYLNRKDSPWYPSMRLFRQPEEGDWEGVMKNITTALNKELAKRNFSSPETAQTKKIEEKQPVAVAQTKSMSNDTAAEKPNANSFFQKGVAAYNNGNLDEALRYFKTIHTAAPQEVGVAYNLAGVYRRLNLLPDAIETYNKVLTINPQHNDAKFGLAQALLAAGTIKEGWQLFNQYRSEAIKQCPTLDQIAGKTILVRHEWGLGDVMHFIRYAKLLKTAKAQKIIVETPAPLMQLLKQCSYIDEVVQHGTQMPKADYQVPLLYLPTLFNTSAENIPAQVPYLHADSSLIMEWRNALKKDENFKIGVCWDIGHHDTNFIGWQRSAPLKHWLPFNTINGISLYSLQKDGNEQLAQMHDALKIHTFGNNLDTTHGGFMDTAAIMKNLDLVITVDTSVAHLAGALGVPVWMLLPYSPDYRWTIEGENTPWYPTMKLFRQKTPGNWDAVLHEVCLELKKLLKQDFVNKESPASECTNIVFDTIESSQLVEKLYQAYGKK